MSERPTTAQAWFVKGRKDLDLSRGADSTREYRADLEDAVDSFDEALALEPSHLGALNGKGQALASLGRHEAAIDALVAAEHVDPGNADLRFAVGQSLAKLERREEAARCFEDVLRLRPGDEEAQTALEALG